MSVPAGFIIERVQDAVDDTSADTKVRIRRAVNSVYIKIAESRPWSALLSQVTNPGTVLPGDLARIFYVEDNTDYLYFPVAAGVRERYSSSKLYNWWKNMAVATPLLTGTDLATTINSVTVTSAAAGFLASMVGEYIRVGSHAGVYKIATFNSTSSIALTDKFHGADWSDPSTAANLTSQYFEVRPQGTLQAAYTDQDGATLTSTSLKLWYSRRPIPIHNDYDEILLPGQCEAVFIGVMKLMLKGDKYVNDALKEDPEFVVALSGMKSLDNLDDKFRIPRDRYGQHVVFGRRRHARTYGIHSERYA